MKHKFWFNKIPKSCSNCHSSNIKLVDNSEIYGKTYGTGKVWICDSCHAYVGVHHFKQDSNGKKYIDTMPLGRFATPEQRKLKQACHEKFDKLWQVYNFDRNTLYKYLAYKLELKHEEMHFGWLDTEYLTKALDILEHIDFKDIWKFIKKGGND